MDFVHYLGTCNAEEIVIPFQVGRPVRKMLSAVICFRQFVSLEHGAHGAVQDEDAFFYSLFQQVCSCIHIKFNMSMHAAGWQMEYVLAGDVTVDTVNSF